MKLNLLYIFLSVSIALSAQNRIELSQDTLLKKSYEKLINGFSKYEYTNVDKSKLYADAYLLKAKNENDSIQIARGYKLISFLYMDKKDLLNSIKYSDSIIIISKNSDHKSYPTLGYYLKGINFYEAGNYKEALNNYLIAKEYAVKKNNENQLSSIKLGIASLKDRYGDYNESLEIYKEYLQDVMNQKGFEKNNSEDYILGLYNISNGYLRVKKPDSAIIYINEGITQSLNIKDSVTYYEFLSCHGIANYQKKNYLSAIDSLEKATENRNGYGLAMCFYYKAQCLKELDNAENAILYFKKSDSIYEETKDVFPELRQVYENLIDEAKSTKDVQSQLVYIEKLLHIDSVLDSDFEYISKNIIKKYDTKILLDDQKKIIDSLNKKTETSSIIIIILILIGIIIIFCSFYYIKYREQLYKKRFDALIESKNTLNKKDKKADNINNIKIADDVADIILKKLKRFEKEKKYLEQGITLTKVAAQLLTNSSYLSKIVNTHKEKNFNSYINNLRINYVVDKLKNDKKFRKYSILSIAEEIGYASSQSFSNAFFKETGIKPSYFIKTLTDKKI